MRAIRWTLIIFIALTLALSLAGEGVISAQRPPSGSHSDRLYHRAARTCYAVQRRTRVLDESLRPIDAWLRRLEERPRLWLAALAGLLALQVDPLWYATPDGVAYLSIARSIAAGDPIARLGAAQLGFPLGYPLLISPAFLIGPRPFLLLSVLHWIMAVAFMLGVYRWARDQLGAAALWVTALAMVNVHVWILYRRTLSEAAFCALLMWTVNLFNGGLVSAPGGFRVRRSYSVLGATMLLALTAVREAGALVAGGFALAQFSHLPHRLRGWRAVAVPLLLTTVAVLLALAALFAVRPERLAAAGPAFAGNLAGYGDAVLAVSGASARLHLRMSEIGQLLVAGMFKAYGAGWRDVNTLVYAPLLLAVLVGWWKLMRRVGDVFVWTAPLYLGLYIAWPYAAGTRYLLPLLPLFWAGLWLLYEPIRRRRVLFAAALAAHLGVAVGYWLAIDAPRARACNAPLPALEQLASHIRRQPAPVAAAGVPTCVALLLELIIDRPVTADHTGAGWIVAPDHFGPFAGFAPAASHDGYTLFALIVPSPVARSDDRGR